MLGFLRRDLILGIDIGDHSIKAVELRVGGERPVIVNAGLIAMDISAEREGEMMRALKELLGAMKPKAKRAITDIPSSDEMVIMRTLFIPEATPEMSEEQIEEATRSEVEQQDYIPYPVDNALISSDLLGEATVDGQKGVEVFFVAVHKELPEARARMLKKLGIQPLAIDVDVLALARLIGWMGIPSEEDVAVVDIGATKTSVFFYHDGKPIFYPHIPHGGNELTEEIVRELDVEWSEAERMKLELDGETAREVLVGSRVKEAIMRAMERPQGLLQALRNLFEHYTADLPAPQKVILTGGSSQLPFIDDLLLTKLDLPVERVSYLDLFDVDDRCDREMIKANQPLFATAVGLALKPALRVGR
ncbi:hypothetical protein DRP77_03565 [Candidatus Poribacteria bacterium]|nr:MAG: hypothetical protein DRP77_03565 [Candidatus Poribacteria bacterium]